MRKQKILIVLFAGSLVLPGVVWAGFSGRFDTENNENRKLAEFPEVNLESLGDFPEQFEAYYKDHVPFKNDLVKFCNFIDTEFFRNTKIGDVVIGEDNWLFYLPGKGGRKCHGRLPENQCVYTGTKCGNCIRNCKSAGLVSGQGCGTIPLLRGSQQRDTLFEVYAGEAKGDWNRGFQNGDFCKIYERKFRRGI